MAHSSEVKREHSPFNDRPNMSDLRIVLLGKNASENSRVRNLILDKQVFVKKTPQPDVETFIRTVERRKITIISITHLLKSTLSLSQISQKVSALSCPEPHVIILVLQHTDFSERLRDRLPSVLNCFGEKAMKRTILLTTDDKKHAKQKSVKASEFIQQISTECGGGRLQLQNTQRSQILQKVDEIITRSEYKKTQQASSLDQEDTQHLFIRTEKPKLILMMCGCNEELKASMLKHLLGKNMPISSKQEFRSECVRRDVEFHGRAISLVELPAVSQLSEEEVMRQTLRCVSLCDPGVHVFLLIVPDAQLTDEDKAEMEKIQNVFDSREHFMPLFIKELVVGEPVTDLFKSSPDSQWLIRLCGGQYRVIGLNEPENSRQIPDLLDYIENMKTEPYSLQMYVKAQENRVRRELQEKLSEMESKFKELQQKIQSEGAEEEDQSKCLRIVLIGRTGNGKSATGNTILGRNEFYSKISFDSVTTVCQKGVGEVDGRSVAVVDTPGFFDTELSNEQVIDEIEKCVSMSAPGPHVFIIVLSLGRFMQVEKDTVDLIKKIFGPKSAHFSIVLFTGGDKLKNESIEDYVRESKSDLKRLIRDCENRFLVFNNEEQLDRTQVTRLLNMIEELKKTEGRYFTNSMFEEAEMSIKRRMEEIMKEKEKEMQTQGEALKAKYEMEKDFMMKRLKEEKHRADSDQFREKEETFRKECEEKIKTEQKKREIENQKRSEEEEQRKAEYHRKIEEMKREIKYQRSQYEKQQKEREDEDRKREEKYRQDQEKMKNEQERIIAELQMKQEEETKRRESEEKKRNDEEEKERRRWEKKLKEAENDRKETKEEIKRQQREWEDEKKRQMREREEDQRKRKEKHEEQLREKQEELEKMRKRFEREREEERQKIEEGRQKQRKYREEKEREYEENKTEMERYYERLERERKEEWERRKLEDDERREEERKRWKKRIEDLKQERDKEIKKREEDEDGKEQEEKKLDDMKKEYENKFKIMRKQYEDEARKQAEEFFESRERQLQHVLELGEMLKEREKQHKILVKVYKNLQAQKGEEIKELQKEVEELTNETHRCVIM